MQAQYQKKHLLQATFAIPKAFNTHIAKKVHVEGGNQAGSPRKSKPSSDDKKLLQQFPPAALEGLLHSLRSLAPPEPHTHCYCFREFRVWVS